MPLEPRSTRLMMALRSESWSGNLPCNALKEACASASLRCEDSWTMYPPDASDGTAVARGAGGCTLWIGGGAAATRSRGAGGDGGADDSCGSSEIGPREGALAAGACFGGVAAAGGLPPGCPSGLIVTVRTRLASGVLPLPDPGEVYALAPPPADPLAKLPDGGGGKADDCDGTREGDEGVLSSTGSSSRGTTRSGGVTSRTRSWMNLPVGPSLADT